MSNLLFGFILVMMGAFCLDTGAFFLGITIFAIGLLFIMSVSA